MTVIPFAGHCGDRESLWQNAELSLLLSIYNAHRGEGEASGWGIGATECGNPQFYILGLLPEQDCTASITRIGRLYILEDGRGQVIAESVSLAAIAERALAINRGRKMQFLAGLGSGWVAAREFFEEKLEPLMAESLEVATHVFPQLATLV